MPSLKLLSAAEQVAGHLRVGLERGQWTGTMPGVNRLAVELGVNRKTVDAALRQLEREGLLAGRGPGRKRLIVQAGHRVAPRPLRVALLLYDVSDRQLDYVVELQHNLVEAGHVVIVPSTFLTELRMDVARIDRLVRQTAADAWVVQAAPREVLEWFSSQPLPTFALFGRREGLPIASTGPDKPPAYAAATRQLIGLGHRRIAMLVRRLRRLPEPGQCEQIFLDELKAHGIVTSAFNLPDWEETLEGLQQLLSKLFQVTPPTALIVDEAPLFIATQQFLAARGLRVPQDVSLICTDPNPAFAWCMPSIAHIRWDSSPVVLRILRWVAAVGRGRWNVRQTLVRAEYVAGGTVGPAPADRMSRTNST